jgi:hypothetical protein
MADSAQAAIAARRKADAFSTWFANKLHNLQYILVPTSLYLANTNSDGEGAAYVHFRNDRQVDYYNMFLESRLEMLNR